MTENNTLNPTPKYPDKSAWILLFLTWVVYAYFTFQTPAQQAMTRYKIDAFQISLLRWSVVIPVLFIWSAILYSYLKLKDYSLTIIKSKDGQGFRFISYGVLFMLISSAVSSFITLAVQFLVKDQIVTNNLRILNNYILVVFSLLSFYLIWKGSKEFLELVNAEKKAKKQNPIVLFVIALLSFPYIYFVLQNPIRSMSGLPDVPSTYNLPDILIFSTIVLPYIISWSFGIFSIVNMSVFKDETKGIIYKTVLSKFYKGFLTVIILVISLQYLTQFSTFFTQASLSTLLVIIYIILLVDAAGLVYVAQGAKQLNRIETV
ncbi:MAG TPA: hypothetical protein VLG67_01920 [Candidatus Saccharimonadales bacterium]|nr:hypothetical protein [Candidatus Saccharimonadales bacterium]